MSVPSRRPSLRSRASLVALTALVLGLLAGPASTGGAQAAPAAHRRAPAATQDEAVLDGVAWLQGRVDDRTHLVTGPGRKVKVAAGTRTVKGAKGKRATRTRWVRRTLPGPAYPSASIDVLMALRRLDPGGATQVQVARALQRSTPSYVGWRFGPIQGRYAGATARMLSVAATSGVPMSEYADGSLRRSLARMVVKKKGDPQRGRVADSGWGGDSSDTVSQAAAVQALATVHSKYLPMAARFLAKQACLGGHFRRVMDSPDYTCKGSGEVRNRIYDVGATSLAVLALSTARSHGVKHLDDEISAASAWLARMVKLNGAVVDHGRADVRTNALAALALRATGRIGSAGNAASWILRQQVDAAMVQRHPRLRGQIGAIAPDRAVLRRAQREGITAGQRKRWVISTAAGAPGLSALLPERRLGVSGVNRRGRLVVRLSGLVVGERFTLERDGKPVESGRAGAPGTVRVVLRRARGPVRLEVVGSRKVRTGVTVVSAR